MNTDFNDRLAVVTGASSGIGLALTERLLNDGACVLAMSRQVRQLGRLQERFGDRLHWLAGDVTKAQDLERLSDYAKTLGPIDFLVPNAGVAQLAQGTDTALFECLWKVNGAGALNTLQVLRKQLAKPASVVFIGTFLSQLTFPGLAAYIASKAALIAQARTLAIEWATEGVRINTVSPGPTATPLWSSLGLGDAQLVAVAASVSQRLLAGRFLDAEAVADVIAFLLSNGARSIYGQEVVVDNGYTLR